MGHSVTSESEDGGLSADSHLSNDNDDTSESLNEGIVLKKGPWTSAEDAILVDYVKRHGEGNWNAIQRNSGLSRCGKSCRLRWANHLRPNLKKGGFTLEEERLIIELHAKMGNKWARMAAHLPGRTDNEIKNYWNTRIKRRQRAGLPLYPPELCPQSLAENQQSVNPRGTYARDKGWCSISQNDRYRAPDVMLDGLYSLPYTAEFIDISAGGSLTNGFGCPEFYSFVPQTMGSQKQYHDLDETMSDYGGGDANEAPPFDRAYNDNVEINVSQPFDPCFPYPDHTEKLLPLGVNRDCHLVSNGFLSASKPLTGAEKSELPSIQYQDTCLGVWDTVPEFMDSFFQSPMGRPLPSDCPSPRSSGLLEALLYEANSLSKSGNQFSDKATSSTISAVYMTDSSALRTCSSEFKGYLDPTSPSSNSIGSFFNECTPTHTGGSSLEEKIPVRLVKSEAADHQSDFYRPDAVLGSSWLGQNASGQKQRDSATDSLPSFLSDDLCTDFKMSDGISSSRWNLTSCAWTNMPSVSQMLDHP